MTIATPIVPTAAQRALFGPAPRRMLIDGRQVDAISGKSFPTIDPATGRILAHIAEGDAADIELAVAAARRALSGPWGRFTPYERQATILRFCDVLESRWDDLCLLDTLEMGAPYGRPRQMILGRLRFVAGLATALHGESITLSLAGDYHAFTRREPIGVVGAIIPWNGPLPATIWKIGPVLATGCTLVLKPAEEASLTALLLGELALEAGVPPGVINIVTGYGETAGAALAGHMDVDKIAFTGSNAVGQHIVRASASNMKRLSLELGGKSPHIVFADADLEAAAQAATMGVFANAGQICAAGTRVFVERAIHDDFVARMGAIARDLRVGSGLVPTTQIGPIVSQVQLDRVSDYLRIGREEGATLVAGGARLTGAGHEGYFVAPTIFTDVRDDMRIAREEIFGPVMSVLAFDTLDEVTARANDTRFGLAAGVWTRDLGKAHRMAQRLQTGSIWVNCYNIYDAALPFGGYKQSGYGRESGTAQLNDYLQVKAVAMRIG